MKEKTKALKPCPFCGAKVNIHPGVVAGISVIVCGSCGATVSFARKNHCRLEPEVSKMTLEQILESLKEVEALYDGKISLHYYIEYGNLRIDIDYSKISPGYHSVVLLPLDLVRDYFSSRIQVVSYLKDRIRAEWISLLKGERS